MLTFFRLIRWKNILVIAATMFAMKYAIIIPVYDYYGITPGLSDFGFIMLTLSSMFIMAGGNIINDYFDRKTDLINRPDEVLVGFKVSRRQAIFMHTAFTLLGVIGGFITAYIAGKFLIGLYFLLISFLIWAYSSNLKRKTLPGNLTLAFLTALIPLNVGITEYYALESSLSEWNIESIRAIKLAFQTIIGFSVFSFLFNLIRELIKDCHDFRGDYKTGIKSVPILIGRIKTNIVISIIAILSALSLAFVYEVYLKRLIFFQNEIYSRIYLYAFIILPVIYLSIRIIPGIQLSKYKHLDNLTKIIMILGLLFSIIFSFAIYGKI